MMTPRRATTQNPDFLALAAGVAFSLCPEKREANWVGITARQTFFGFFALRRFQPRGNLAPLWELSQNTFSNFAPIPLSKSFDNERTTRATNNSCWELNYVI